MKVLAALVHPVEAPEDTELVMEVLIDCQMCGEQHFRVMGHHLPALVEGLRKAMETYPELVTTTATEVPRGSTVVVPKTTREH